ncbi:MAG: hypothetical protein LBO09_08825 [Candidatus Peribacteria bacterium]|jgi:hypothetical protein|nr:hypothetical protein [Candidatus Peribacteria bacterium]
MSANLKFYFQPKYESVYPQSSFSHKFNELGCQYIDLTVDDTELGKQDYSRIRFKVQNALPTLKNIALSFPQYSNESGIGFQENKVQNVLDPGGLSSENLIVKVTAVGATDPDSPNGEVAYFKRYYYPKDNPNQILETRITPSNIPYTFFTLPRIAGEYMFGVTMYDSDDGYQKSEQIIGNGPTVFFPQTDNNPDIPIVTLKFDKQTVNVGDTVTFDVIAKVTSDNSDFVSHRTIQYDFDGDGERDLITTKDRATYTYTQANERGYSPKAAVIYRGYKGISEVKGNTLVVRNSVKPILTFNSIKNIVIFRDLSVGNMIQRSICFEEKECTAGNKSYQKIHIAPNTSSTTMMTNTPITQNRVFLQKYNEYGAHEVSIALKSSQGENVSGTYTVTTSNNVNNGRITSGVHLITIPETAFSNKDPEIYVGKTMDNSVLFYLYHEGAGQCFIDTDISQDSDKDGKPDNDEDIKCNTLILRKYQPQFETIVGRMYFENAGRLVFKNFSVDFEGFDVVMDQNNLLIYQDITTLFNGIEDRNIGNADLKVLLLTLKQNLLDKNQTTNNIVQLKEHLANSVIYLDAEQNALLESIISRLENSDTISAMGWNAYEQAREDILISLPENLRVQVATKFSNFELSAENLDNAGKKDRLNEILKFIADNADTYKIPTGDLNGLYVPQFCKIFGYYEIGSDKCSTESSVATPDIPPENINTSDGKGGLPGRLKVILRII